jgi:hypothetical protein
LALSSLPASLSSSNNFEIGSNDNASFPVYHRLSTVIFVSSKQYVEMFTIDPVDLQAALDKDVA